MHRQHVWGAALVALGLATGTAAQPGDEESSYHKVMGSVTVAPGEHTGDVSSVNGSIKIGENAVVGRAQTVNGSVKLDERATAAAVATVNGSVQLRDGARVTERAETVNGSMSLEHGAEVGGKLGNVNDSIRVADSHVGGDIETVSGDLEIGPNARVDGDISVRRSSGTTHSDSVQRVVIGPGSIVRGSLKFERPVQLYVSDRATIGAVEGATAIRFSGEHPSQ